MNLILRDETVFNFKECVSGLYYYDMTSNDVKDSDKANSKFTPYYLLLTVTKSKEFYTRANIEGVDRSRRYQGLLG